MENKHTPGPLDIVTHKDGRHKEFVIMQTNGMNKVATAPYHHVTKETALANAHIIAAAPDMLDALELMCKQTENMAKLAGVWLDGNVGYIAARAAIAKARGQ